MNTIFTRIAATLAAALLVALPGIASSTGGRSSIQTNRQFQSFTDAQGITSRYHMYASELDWSKKVGFLLYTDGSGGYGFDNPNSTYLLDADGSAGLVSVAKKHNMLLLVPEAPGPSCNGYDNCWYNESGTPTPVQKAQWVRNLVDNLYTQYPIDKQRVAIGGYSSGAQFTSRWFVPTHGAAIQEDGVFVPIAYGGAPRTTATQNLPVSYKANVVGSWDTGTDDKAYTSTSYGAIGGYNWYTNNGFTTEANWPAGVGHSRSGEFDNIMDREITQHVPAATDKTTSDSGTEPIPAPAPFATTVTPTVGGAKFLVDVPANTSPATYVYVYYGNSNYKYLYSYRDGNDVSPTFTTLRSKTYHTYKVWSNGVVKAEGSFRTL